MEQVLTLVNEYNGYISIALTIFLLITIVLLLVTIKKFKNIQNRYERFMKKEDVDFETLLTNYATEVEVIKNAQIQADGKISFLEDKIKHCTQKIGIVRYDAYDKGGADLSFAIAVLDDNNDGFVINGIYTRDGSYTYGKPIEDGKSKHTLSEEELKAIEKAIKK